VKGIDGILYLECCLLTSSIMKTGWYFSVEKDAPLDIEGIAAKNIGLMMQLMN
jgi:hypothetical protein